MASGTDFTDLYLAASIRRREGPGTVPSALAVHGKGKLLALPFYPSMSRNKSSSSALWASLGILNYRSGRHCNGHPLLPDHYGCQVTLASVSNFSRSSPRPGSHREVRDALDTFATHRSASPLCFLTIVLTYRQASPVHEFASRDVRQALR